MGRKKKFIDKKKAATFQLMARDSSDPIFDESVPGSERVFVRVDGNVSYNVDTFNEDCESTDGDDDFDCDPNSVFADAPGDEEEVEGVVGPVRPERVAGKRPALPDSVRKEILELGFPDDGYNYMIHLREIKNTGGGSAYFSNPKAKIEPLPSDVKAYDASRIPVPEVKATDPDEKSMYKVATKSVGVRVKKAVDPEVAALLDYDSDMSRFGSDVEDLEEDFMVMANAPGEGEDFEEDEVDEDKNVSLVEEAEVSRKAVNEFHFSGHHQDTTVGHRDVVEEEDRSGIVEAGINNAIENSRERRLLDEQFDMLELQEYGSDSDDGYIGDIGEEDESRGERLQRILNKHELDDLELDGNKYRAPADILRDAEAPESKEPLGDAADLIRRCVEYGHKYENETHEDVVVVEESSDDSEVWDCQTIVSTYSNLENHPEKIGVPETARQKKLALAVAAARNSSNQKITLRGKERLPTDYLPGRKPVVTEKPKDVSSAKTEQEKKKAVGQETKEEKKERKAAVKEERREARRVKKEVKGLYKYETQRAQKLVATSAPTSVHLM